MVCDDIHHCRTVPIIIFSCASTMFLCTWVAYHPDVPKNPEAVWWKKLSRRIRYMVVAFLAPEYVFWTALEQWTDACRNFVDIKEKYSDCHLTETHFMFGRMGGFLLESGSDRQQLRGDEFFTKLIDGEIEMPTIPESEIQDKSKGDDVAKAITLIQTLWFAIQAANRVSQGLTVTEFELTTLAHVVLNVFIYWCWWKKPLNVNRSVAVYSKQNKEGEGNAKSTLRASQSGDVESQTRPLPFRIRIGSRIPDPLFVLFILPVMSGMFGAMHCLAWNLSFPTHIEHTLWRVSALIVTASPILIFVLSICVECWRSDEPSLGNGLKSPWVAPMTTVYCLARICLLVLALIALRALPYNAYITPSWTRFIPHIG